MCLSGFLPGLIVQLVEHMARMQVGQNLMAYGSLSASFHLASLT